MLAGTLATNELVISEAVDRVVACDGRTVALLGLSFKMDTDDLRESPNAELAERLIGKGFDVRIYDPVVNPARLIGANRRHIEAKLPHLGRLLAREPSEALRGADVAIVSSADPAIIDGAAHGLAASPARPVRAAGREHRVTPRLRGDRLVTRVLIIVQNLPVPFDRRVWLECQALVSDGLPGRRGLPQGQRRPGLTRSSTASSCTSTGPMRRAAASSASSPSTPTPSSPRPG